MTQCCRGGEGGGPGTGFRPERGSSFLLGGFKCRLHPALTRRTHAIALTSLGSHSWVADLAQALRQGGAVEQHGPNVLQEGRGGPLAAVEGPEEVLEAQPVLGERYVPVPPPEQGLAFPHAPGLVRVRALIPCTAGRPPCSASAWWMSI